MSEGEGVDSTADVAEIKRHLGSVAERLSPAELEWLIREWQHIEHRRRALAQVATDEWDFEAVVRPDSER
jgi:hypothetical protein